MDIGAAPGNTGVMDEASQQKALLAWATSRIDQLGRLGDAPRLDDLVDWLAYFTREFFGFQQRVLSQCAEQHEYLFSRMAAHCEFRRRLATLSIDMIRGDATVPERLRELCHDLLADAEANDQKLTEIFGRSGDALRPRKQARRARPAEQALQLFPPKAARSGDEVDSVSLAH